jgi:hypothetical protein
LASTTAGEISLMNYMVLYEGGNCGTWLTWLINQHEDFPKFNLKDAVRKNIMTSKDVICHGASWHLEEINVDDGYGNIVNKLPLSWENYVQYSKQYVVNKKHKHIAFKIVPNHDARKHFLPDKPVDVKLLDSISKQTRHKIVFCYVGECFNYEISRRWNILRKEKESIEDIKNTLVTDRRTKYDIQEYSPFTTDICVIDIGKIITCDMAEYGKLCNFIDQPKLNEFKKLANDYRKSFF